MLGSEGQGFWAGELAGTEGKRGESLENLPDPREKAENWGHRTGATSHREMGISSMTETQDQSG